MSMEEYRDESCNTPRFEVIGQCEGCGKTLFDNDDCSYTLDDIYLCKKCSQGIEQTTAKEETDNQTIRKEESVSTHTEGGGGSPLKSPDYMEGYVDGYNDCRDFANGKINSLLERLKCQNKPT